MYICLFFGEYFWLVLKGHQQETNHERALFAPHIAHEEILENIPQEWHSTWPTCILVNELANQNAVFHASPTFLGRL